jgi:NADPH:quinone reductase-like Zn-dependent oxidoreductase
LFDNLLPDRCVALLPEGKVDLREAACIPVSGLTAYESLEKISLSAHSNGTVKGRTLLVIGGSGGVGSWAITLARAWHPSLNIIATATTQEQRDWCLSLGANQVMGHDEILQKMTGGREGSADAILCLSEPTQPLFDACAEIIKPYGSICLVVAGKSIESLNLSFLFFKCANVVLETVFSSIRTKYQQIVPSEELTSIVGLLARQSIRAPLSPDLETCVSESFKNAKKEDGVLKALAVSSGKRRGKLILRVQTGNDIIFIDLKTASILQIPRRLCIGSNVLHPTSSDTKQSGTFWKEQVKGTERTMLVQKITSHPTLGVSKVSGKQVTDYEEGLDLKEAANVQNLWGVTLKKRSKNEQGEELLFLDPANGVLGEVSRQNCLTSHFIKTQTDESGKETLEGAIRDGTDLDFVIQTIRKSLNLNLEKEK